MAEGIKKISENVIIDKRALVITDPSVADNAAISTGALWANPNTKGLKIKTASDTLSLLDAAQTLITGSITTSLLKDKCVTGIKLADKAVVESTIGDLAVSSRTIQSNAVTEAKIASQAISSSKIKDANVLNKHYADLSITNSKVADKTLEGTKLKDLAIDSLQINSNAITETKIANNAIVDRHYKDLSIPTRAYQKQSVYGDVIKSKGITSLHLADNSVAERAIMNGAVTSLKIADNAVQGKHLADACVESSKLASNSVLTKHIADNALTTSKYANKSITKDKLAADIVDLIGDPVMYDKNNNVSLRKDLDVSGDVRVTGTLTANKVFNSVFMDLAEAYEPSEDETFIPGDIVQVNDEGKLIKGISTSHFPIVGIVSDEYAACYGAEESELEEGTKIAVGLIGKVHVNVVGPVRVGDKIALAKDGLGASQRTNNLSEDYIIGKALESSEDVKVKKILCLIYPR